MNGAPNENRTHSCRFASLTCYSFFVHTLAIKRDRITESVIYLLGFRELSILLLLWVGNIFNGDLYNTNPGVRDKGYYVSKEGLTESPRFSFDYRVPFAFNANSDKGIKCMRKKYLQLLVVDERLQKSVQFILSISRISWKCYHLDTLEHLRGLLLKIQSKGI